MKITERDVLSAILEKRISEQEIAYLIEEGRKMGRRAPAAALMAALALGSAGKAYANPSDDINPMDYDTDHVSSSYKNPETIGMDWPSDSSSDYKNPETIGMEWPYDGDESDSSLSLGGPEYNDEDPETIGMDWPSDSKKIDQKKSGRSY